jgi:hypothetical protein
MVLLLAGTAAAVESPHGDLDIACETCHVTSGWTEVHFSHEGTGFELDRSHARVECGRCHAIADFSATRPECGSCHPDVHEGGLGPDCGRCHTPDRWERFDVDRIHAETRSPLMDRHVRIDCRNCHPALLEGDYATSAAGCVDCHEDAYLATANPGHVKLGLGTLCEDCHEPVRWRHAFFPSHDALFPIFSGEHRGAWGECSDCHPDPSTFGAFTCSACHRRPDMDEEHRDVSGYVYEDGACLACHPDGTKGEGIGNHDADFFPITSGAHDGTWSACSQCHTAPGDYGVFSCVGCHEHDRAPMDASHAGIPGYAWESGQCYACHPTGEGAEFGTHDALYFPVYTGSHEGTWDLCADCHTTEGDFSAYSCVACHEHDQAPMDAAHQGIPDYTWESARCYACHPTGEGGEFRDHDALYFPVYTGSHEGTWDLCADCHTTEGDFSAYSCVACHEHDRSPMDTAHQGIPDYAYDSDACYTCHPAGEGGEFGDHDGLYFPIYSGKHREKWDLCADCHPTPGDYAVFTCIDCHEHRQSKMDDKHREVNDYVYDSDACYECHPRGEERFRWKRPLETH